MPEVISGIFIIPLLKAYDYTSDFNSFGNNKCHFTAAKL
jgi:hypothetical protein